MAANDLVNRHRAADVQIQSCRYSGVGWNIGFPEYL
jgi:hypothetical protein